MHRLDRSVAKDDFFLFCSGRYIGLAYGPKIPSIGTTPPILSFRS
jgi:hypothetical protein